MTIKKLKFISTISIFLISCFTHFGYDIFPRFITSLFFPVNESIFEHMKMINMSYIIYALIELIIIKLTNLKVKNFMSSVSLTLIFNIVIFLIVYLPIYYIFGYNTIITLSLYFISIVLSTIFNYKIQTSSQNYYILNKYSLLIMIFITFTFSYLTYYPIENSLFIDSTNKKLGLNNYY